MTVPGRTKTGLERGAARRRLILLATRELIARHGVGGLRLNAVAERAGVGRAGLLHHFPSKEALLHAILDEHQRSVLPLLTRIAEPGGLASVRALAEIARNDVDDRLWAAMWSELLTDAARPEAVLHDRLVRAYEAYQVAVHGFLESARANGELRADVDIPKEAILIIGMIRGLETSWLVDERVPLVDLVELFLDQTIERLRA